MKRFLRSPIEAFRTAPVPLTVTAITCLGALTLSVRGAVEPSGTPNNAVEWGIAAYCVGATVLNAVLAREKFELRDRVEEILQRDGFNDRVMAVTTPTYCGRQAVRIACENTDYMEEYAKLCEEKAGESLHTWLPHI